jgi:predicted Zn-dependent protease
MRILLSAVVALSLLAFASPALADRHVHKEAKVSIDVPAGWKVDGDEDHMTVTDPKEEVAFFFIILDAKDLDKATSEMEKEIGKAVKNVKWEGEPEETKLNGMDAILLDGSGKIDGQAVELGVAAIVTPAAKVLLVLGVIEASKSKKHEKAVVALLTSIKPVK